MNDAPCKGCIERILCCHSQCEKYKEFVNERQEINKKLHDEHVLNAYAKSAVSRMKDRNERRKSQFLKTQRK